MADAVQALDNGSLLNIAAPDANTKDMAVCRLLPDATLSHCLVTAPIMLQDPGPEGSWLLHPLLASLLTCKRRPFVIKEVY